MHGDDVGHHHHQVRQHLVVSVVGQACWKMAVVEKEGCGLLMVPKLSIGVCRCSLLGMTNPQHD